MKLVILASLLVLGAVVGGCQSGAPSIVLQKASHLELPGKHDSNCPAHWDQATLYVFTSVASPTRTSGKDLLHLGPPQPTKYNQKFRGGGWLECTWKADDGTLYGWCHSEPMLAPGSKLAVPQINALRSRDNGLTWDHLGTVLTAPAGTARADAKNGYFAGGVGDFCVMLDPRQEYLYFFFSNYAGPVSEQGVAVARMKWADRDKPLGAIRKWHSGQWDQPGVGGRVTPIFQAAIEWARADADAFWGPAVHYNTHLKMYVMLLNRTKDRPGWPQEGICWSYADDLSRPSGWSTPAKFFQTNSWYPQVIGTDATLRETDKLAGRKARFFVAGRSDHEIIFLRPGEKP